MFVFALCLTSVWSLRVETLSQKGANSSFASNSTSGAVRCFSIVRPFFADWELEIFVNDMEEWGWDGKRPCPPVGERREPGFCTQNTLVDMVFLWDADGVTQKEMDDAFDLFERTIAKLQHFPARNNFRKLVYEYTDVMTPEFFGGAPGETGETHIMRANAVFHEMYSLVNVNELDDQCPNGKEAFFLFETDLKAIRRDWLADLLIEWIDWKPKTPKVLGSKMFSRHWEDTPHWAALEPFKDHLNGNSLYATTPEFKSFVDCILAITPSVAFDVLIYQWVAFAADPATRTMMFAYCACAGEGAGGRCTTVCHRHDSVSLVAAKLDRCIPNMPAPTDYVDGGTVLNLYRSYVEPNHNYDPAVGLVHGAINVSEYMHVLRATRSAHVEEMCTWWQDWEITKGKVYNASLLIVPSTKFLSLSLQDMIMMSHLAFVFDWEVVIPASPLHEPIWFPASVNWFHPVLAEDEMCLEVKEEIRVFVDLEPLPLGAMRFCRRKQPVAYLKGAAIRTIANLMRVCPKWDPYAQCCHLETDLDIIKFMMAAGGEQMNDSPNLLKLKNFWLAQLTLSPTEQKMVEGENWVCPMEKLFVLGDPKHLRNLAKWKKQLPPRYATWYIPDTSKHCLFHQDPQTLMRRFEAVTSTFVDNIMASDDDIAELSSLPRVVFANDEKFLPTTWANTHVYNLTKSKIKKRAGQYRSGLQSEGSLSAASELRTQAYPGGQLISEACKLGTHLTYTFVVMPSSTDCVKIGGPKYNADEDECRQAAFDMSAPFEVMISFDLPVGCAFIIRVSGDRHVVYNRANNWNDIQESGLWSFARYVLDISAPVFRPPLMESDQVSSICKNPVQEMDTKDEDLTKSILASLGDIVVTGVGCMDTAELTGRRFGYHCTPTCTPPHLQICSRFPVMRTCIDV